MRLHVGTSNPGKLREYREILAPLGYEVVTVVAPEPDEPEPDLEGNARLKASAYGFHAGGLTLAEDSGLVVPALHGLPGVVSARFSDCELDLSTADDHELDALREVMSPEDLAMLAAGGDVDVDGPLSIDEIRVARCRHCDHELYVGNAFCTECGTKIEND